MSKEKPRETCNNIQHTNEFAEDDMTVIILMQHFKR